MQTKPSLNVHSVANVRDLGGYDTPSGPTLMHRFVRCGGTASITRADLKECRRWGVTRVLDLRSAGESPRATCRFSQQRWVRWENVPLYDIDISAPTMMPAHDTHNYLVQSYLHMLALRDAVRRCFAFCAEAADTECVLFHCAAGMDRTGMLAMLLLGLVEVPREQIIADYCYSFAQKTAVDAMVHTFCVRDELPKEHRKGDFIAYLLRSRLEAISTVYDTLGETHGTVRTFLEECGVHEGNLEAVRARLISSESR